MGHGDKVRRQVVNYMATLKIDKSLIDQSALVQSDEVSAARCSQTSWTRFLSLSRSRS